MTEGSNATKPKPTKRTRRKLPADISGMQFGRLEAVRFSRCDRSGPIARDMWFFRCSCGVEKELNRHNVMAGTTKSCGCLRVDQLTVQAKSKEGVIKWVFNTYRREAGKRDLEFRLSQREVTDLIFKDCAYCGYPPCNVYNGAKALGIVHLYNGIDRVDTSVGYLTDNVVTCCRYCNFAKGTRPVEDFLKWLDHVRSSPKPST